MQQYELAKIVLENLNLTCYIIDLEDNTLLYINKPFEGDLARFFQGAEHSDKCYKFLHNGSKPCANCHNGALIHGKKVRKEVYDSVSKKYYTQVDTLIKVNNRYAKLAMIYDPSLASDDIESITQKLTLEETLVSCIHTLVEDDETDNAMQTLLSIVASYYGSKHAYVYELNSKNNTARKTYEYGADGAASYIAVNHALPIKIFEPIIKVFSERGEFAFQAIENDLDHDSEIYKFLKNMQVHSLLLVPYYVDGKLAYCMGVDAPSKKTDDLSLLHSVIIFVVDKIRKNKIYNQLVYLSYSDALTNLWNRNKYNQRLEELSAIELATFGYTYINLNRLKDINELYGEQYGDEILKKTAKLLSKHLGADIFRLAGNEFVALSPNISSDDFNKQLLGLREELKTHSEFSLSIGGVYQYKKIDIRKGVFQAFDIMFAEKQKFYKNDAINIIQSRQNPVQIVLDELNSGNFTIYLQPKVNLLTEEITSAEALIRKFDKNGKLISPNNFIPIYESEGTVRHIDFFVLEEVCRLLHKLIKKNRALKIAVNFSRVTFLSPNLLEEIILTCAKYNIPHEYIKIEITESIEKMDFEFFDKKLKKIKNAGFEISLDDFGAKHSNLLMLTMTEFSEVKIDKGLIDYITQSAQNRALVKNILKMITDLGTSICVAEGIETKEQKDMILDFGCEHGQGYYFYRPMPVEEFLVVYEMNINKCLLNNTLENEKLFNLNLSYNEMFSIIEAMPFCVTILDQDKQVISCNQCVIDTFGLNSKEEFLSKLFTLSPETQPNGENSRELAFAYLDEAYQKGYLHFPWVHKTKQGKEFSAEVILKKLKVKGSEEFPLMAGFIREISPEIVNHSVIDWVQQYGFNNDISDRTLITTLLEISNEWLWTYNYNTKQMMFFGEGYEEFGLPKEKFIFPDTFIANNHVYVEDMPDFIKTCEFLNKGEHRPSELRFNLPDGSLRYFKLTYKIIKNQEGLPISAIGKMADIDEQKKNTLFWQVDELTGCHNARAAKMHIDNCLLGNKDSLHALFVIDVNKLFGLSTGTTLSRDDSILTGLSAGLLANFREGDIVARIEDNNFIVFLKNPPHLNVVMDKMAAIESILMQNSLFSQQCNIIKLCIGLALYTKNGDDYEQLLHYAKSSITTNGKVL